MFDSLAGMTFVSNSGTASFCDGHASFNKLTPYLNIVERTRPEGGRKGGRGKEDCCGYYRPTAEQTKRKQQDEHLLLL